MGSTITSTTTTTTTQAYHCVGNDSRCAEQPKNEERCLELKSSGAHCRWEVANVDKSGKCTGTDSRCKDAVQTWCETLGLKEGADCKWRLLAWRRSARIGAQQ